MAEALINSAESNTLPNGVSDPPAPSPSGSLFHRRIEFRPARKPFTGFSIGSGDFRLETLNPGSKPQRPGSNQGSGPLALAGKKPDGSEFVENGLDPELSFGITFRRIGAGLENLGNTCFLNSVLQCLTYTEPLAAYLQSGKHQTSCRTAGFCALCAIQKHVSRALQSTGRILAPKDLVSNLRCISRTFRNSRQEDAHEYMVNLLESMHKCCLPSGVPSESPSAYEKSLVHKIFGGSLRSQVKCMQCSFCSNKFDPFLDLSLEIVKAESLYKALAHFTAKEQLDGGERHYQCQQCKQKVKALKQLTIHKAPYVLTIHLKRFGSHVPGQKIDKKIPFGPTLDLKPFVTGPYDGDLKYTLYGVLVHAGWSTHSGHYYCFVRTSSGMWYSLDDNQVVQVNERKVLEQKAYMLFYVRDRGNFASKKPVDVAKKENMVISSVGRNKVYSNFNQGSKETNQNGPIDKRLNGPNSAGASKETAMKEESNQKINGLMMAKRSALNKEHPLEHSSKLLPLKNSVKGLSGECLPQSVSSAVKASHDTLKLDNAVTKMTAAKFAEFGVDRSTKMDPCDSVSRSLNCTEDRSTKKDTVDSVTIPLNHIIRHQSSGDICTTETTSTTSSGKNGNNASSLDFSERKISTVMSVCRASRDVSQTGGFSEERTIDSVSAELSSLPIKTCISLPKKALDPKPHQKMSKKLLKRQVTSMHLSSSILFGSSLIMRKKKHKRSKQCALGIKNLSRKHFLNGDFIPTDLEPSTSEKFGTMPLGGSAHSRRKGVDSGSKKKDKSSLIKNVGTNSNGDLLMGVIDKEVRERIGQNDAMIAAEDRPQKSSTATASVGNQLDDRGSNGLKDSRRGSMQNGLMNMLTRGLEDTIVARWDERELYPARMTEASGVESVSIGYVADEWDEELDRGKRKKVRTSNNIFGGPNPFQEIATTKAKLKKAKTDRSSSGNQPFRI